MAIFCFLTWVVVPRALHFLCSEIKLQNTGKESWAIPKEVRLTGHTEPGNSGGPETRDMSSKDLSARKSHPKGATLL